MLILRNVQYTWNYWRVKYLMISHAYSLNGVHLIWQYLRQIKATAKYTMYMVQYIVIYYLDTVQNLRFECKCTK